jgi:adenylate cyclase
MPSKPPSTNRRKIGGYLSLKKESIEQVLELQNALRESDIAKLSGEILVETEKVSADELRSALDRQKIDIMKRLPVFASIPIRALRILSPMMEHVFIREDVECVSQDGSGDHLYIVLDGTARAYWLDDIAGRMDLGLLGPGDIIGEIDYFFDGKRSASVRSITRVHVLQIKYSDLKQAFKKIPILAVNFLEHLQKSNLHVGEILNKSREAERALKSYQSFLNLSELFDLRITIEELLVKNVTMASKIMEADRASLFLVDKAAGQLWSRVAEGSETREIRIPIDKGIAGWVAQNKTILNIEDAYSDERFNPEVDKKTGYHTRSILCGPVINLEGELLGVVQIINKKIAQFSEQDEKVFRILSQQIAISLDNFYLSKKVMSNYEKVSVLLDIANVAAQTMDLKLLIPNLVNKISQILNSERASLFLLNKATHELWSKAAQDLEISEIRFPVSMGIAGDVVTTGKGRKINNVYADPHFNPAFDQQTGFSTRNMLCVPVLNRFAEIVGVTQVMNKRGGDFTDDDQELLQALSSQISMALENATLFDQVVTMRNYLENIQQSISNSIVSLDSHFRLVTANRAFYALFEAAEGTLKNTDFFDLLGTGNNSFADAIRGIAESKLAFIEFNMPLTIPGGKQHIVNVNGVPLFNETNEYDGTVLVIENITEERRLKSTLTRYMPKAVVDKVLNDQDRQKLGGTRNKVTVLFSDIRGFTALTEKLTAVQTVDFINECFSLLSEILFKYDAVLDKYIGDAIMAVFGVPYERDDDAVRAVKSALDMHAVLDTFNNWRMAQGKEQVRIGIGISTGEVLSGNIGSEQRMDYTVIGDDVNISAYLEKRNKQYGTKVLISESTKEAIGDVFTVRLLDEVIFKGKMKPVKIYEVLGEKNYRLAEHEQIFDRGFDLYRKHDFLTARDIFGTQLDRDQVCRVFWERCNILLKNPPSSDWNGVWKED